MSPDDSLSAAWHALAGTGHEATLDLLTARHSEPHRHYHTAIHVSSVLQHVEDILADEPSPESAVDADAVRAGALFHDLVYDPRSSTNETDSADIAIAALGEVGWTADRLALLRELIEATATHQARSFEAAVLIDADLAILGADPRTYGDYVNAVRLEFAFVSESDWHSGRALVLHSFLDRRQIYVTTTMAAARERQARINLNRELAALGDRLG